VSAPAWSGPRAPSSSARIAPTDEAVVRIQKILSAAFGIGAVLFGALTLGPIQEQVADFDLWWTLMAMAFTFGLPAAMAICAAWASRRTLRILASAAAAGYLLSLATLWPALHGGHLPQTPDTPWLLEITAIGTSAAALAWRAWLVWTYTGAIAATIIVDRILCGGPSLVELAFEDALYTLLFASILSSLVLVTLAAGRSLDRATHSARIEAAEAAGLQARQQERARMEALTHDRVLSTLLTAAHDGAEFREAAAQQARKALAELEELKHPVLQSAALDPEPFVWALQAATTDIAADAFFDYELPQAAHHPATPQTTTAQPSAPRVRPIPREVVDAVSEALGEALRNSVKHAEKPGGTNRAVHVLVTDHVVRVGILDDGPGFDTENIPARRLGIQISIAGRLEQLEGGSAVVRSRPGVGTTVMLEWRRP
jgi:signal transduction histidine kinase